jgi:acetaldehyde dehydrogenase (acetylating)
MRNEQEKAAVSGLIEEIVSELKKQGIYGGDR